MKTQLFRLAAACASFTAALAIQSAAPAQTSGFQASGFQASPSTLGGGETIRLDLSGPERDYDLAIPRGKSAPLNFTTDMVRQVHVSDTAIADIQSLTPGRFIITGRTPGQTDARFYDAAGRTLLTLNIRVEIDVRALHSTIGRIAPNSRIEVEAINNSVILTGQADSIADADAAVQIARRFVGKPEDVLNRLSVNGNDQVMLSVRVAEVQRSVIKQLGFDMSALYGQVGGNQINFSNAASFAVNGGLLGGATSGLVLDTTQQPMLEVACADPALSGCYTVVKGGTAGTNWQTAVARASAGSDGLNKANGTIKAFERAGLLRLLAEPNLTAVSGEAAKFLAGGEYPVPTGLDAQGRVSVDFKPYGVGLGYTPVVLSGGRIALKLSVEVSELSSQGAYTVVSGNGQSNLTIPGLTVRRAETSVELPSGGSMMIAGLLQESTRQNIDKIPGVADLPVLGALARSRDFLSGETELVIIITAYLVKPGGANAFQTPADGLQIANDAQTLLLGRLNQAYGTKPAAVQGRSYQGAFGHVIE